MPIVGNTQRYNVTGVSIFERVRKALNLGSRLSALAQQISHGVHGCFTLDFFRAQKPIACGFRRTTCAVYGHNLVRPGTPLTS